MNPDISARTPIDFRSDNVGSVSAEIIAAAAAANAGTAASYGEDAWSRRLDEAYSALFQTSVKVFPVSTGTAANALALSAATPPYGAIFCYEAAHIHTSEAGASEFFSGGAKLSTLAGEGFRFQAPGLGRAVAAAGVGVRNKSQPAAVSVTQATEHGTLYRLDELKAIGQVARNASLKLHMDGARFANALVGLSCSPADMTWRNGLDILSFGATKNGGMNCDAIVVFDLSLAEDLSYRLRRAGQTWSKMRFPAAQLLAYVEGRLFLRSARRANALAARIAAGVRDLPGAGLVAPVEANLVFLDLPEHAIEALAARGFLFLRRSARMIRLVCRFDGTEEEVDLLLDTLRRSLETRVAAAG